MKVLEDYMRLMGINRTELAKRLEMSLPQLSKMLAGINEPTVRTLKRISAVTGIPLAVLARDVGEEYKPKPEA